MFGGFSRRLYDVGTFGNGSRMKFVANHLVAIHNVATAEAMKAQNLSKKKMAELMKTSRAQVDAFHKAAIAAGGKDNGPPGPRPEYHAGYYSAFVLDPDGNNVEAVCHASE